MAARLDSMRKERDDRAKSVKKAPVPVASAVEPLQFDAVEPLQFDESDTMDVAVMEAEKSPKKQKKKKKKRKNKK